MYRSSLSNLKQIASIALWCCSFMITNLALAASPPPNPLPPTTPFPAGKLPVVLVNNSNLPDSQINVVVLGKTLTSASPPSQQCFVQFDTSSGIGTLVVAAPGDNASNYSKPLSVFPITTSGRVLYLPQIDSSLIYFSVTNPLNMPVNAPNSIVQPNFTSPADPNYNTIFDIFELAYVPTTPNIAVDATAVSFFSIPLYGYLSTSNDPLIANTGLYQARSDIMAHAASMFSSVPEAAQWNNLFLTSNSTILRLLSTGKAMTATPSLFDLNYLDNASAYGYSYLADIWTGPSSYYRTHPLTPLTLTIPNGSGETYTGVINSDNTITFTSAPSGYKVIFAAPTTTSPPFTTSETILSAEALQIFDNSPSTADGVQVSKLFEEAIIAGLVPTPNTLSNTYLTNNQLNYYNINPNLTAPGGTTGPWYDLYSKALHSLGSIYTFGFDEPLWPQVLISSNTLVANQTYLGITIGPLTGTSTTTTALSVFPTSASIGLPVTFTAKVSAQGGGGTPTGTVTFSVDGVLETPVFLVNGQATFQTSNLALGSHTILAIYSGDASQLASTSTPVQVVVGSTLPPTNLRVHQVQNRYGTQTDLVNVISWQKPSSGVTPAFYKIYRDPQLTQLIGTVAGNNNSFQDHNRRKNQVNSYYVVAVDASGTTSSPAVVVYP